MKVKGPTSQKEPQVPVLALLLNIQLSLGKLLQLLDLGILLCKTSLRTTDFILDAKFVPTLRLFFMQFPPSSVHFPL